MGKIGVTMLFAVSILVLATNLFAMEQFSIPIGATYNSTYWWRGIELNGKNAAVLWPRIGLEYDSTIAYVTVGINQDYYMVNENGDKALAKSYNEVDYGIEYNIATNIINTTVGIKYTHYPFYDSAGATVDPSFIEVYVIASYALYFVPTIEVYYDYYVEETADKTPVNQDVYAKFTLFKDLVNANNFICKTGIWTAYYNNAYLDRKGFSDGGITLSITYEYDDVTFFSAFNYARTLTKDFYIFYDSDANGKNSKLKNHLWTDVGVATKL